MFFTTYIHRDEYFPPDLLDRFGDAEPGWMIAPRPLMIEKGSRDRAVPIHHERTEFKRVAESARFAGFDWSAPDRQSARVSC